MTETKAGHAANPRKDYPSTDKDTPHAQDDNLIWDDEVGWRERTEADEVSEEDSED